jgi:hypothetical protein
MLPNSTTDSCFKVRKVDTLLNFRTVAEISWPVLCHSSTDMGEITKQRQLNEKIRYMAVRDLGFYETRWILFEHCLWYLTGPK